VAILGDLLLKTTRCVITLRTRHDLFRSNCDNRGTEISVTKSRFGYEGNVIEARLSELKDGGVSAEFSVEEHDGSGVTETRFYLPDTFATQESAVEAGIQAGRQKVDVAFEPRRAVVNW
jgi:hypothetical protein